MASRVLCTVCGRSSEDPGELAGYSCGHCSGALIRVPVPSDQNVSYFVAACVGAAVGGAFIAVPGAFLGMILGSLVAFFINRPIAPK